MNKPLRLWEILKMKRYNKGFTLIELLVTLVIMTIIMAIGVPSFQTTISNSRLTTAINELSTSMNLARSEAIKRNRSVTIRKKDNVNWESGWIIFTDINADGSLDGTGDATACDAGNECILKDHEALPNNLTLRPNNTVFNNFVRYTSSGMSSAGNVSFYLCDTSTYSSTSLKTTVKPNTVKVLVLNAVGRPRMAVDANHDGIPEVIKPNPDVTNIGVCDPTS